MNGEEELRQAVKENGTIGLLGAEDGSIIILHPRLSEKTVRAIMVMLYNASDIDIKVESIYKNTQPIPFNKRMTPVFICFEALIIGFILGGALYHSHWVSLR